MNTALQPTKTSKPTKPTIKSYPFHLMLVRAQFLHLQISTFDKSGFPRLLAFTWKSLHSPYPFVLLSTYNHPTKTNMDKNKIDWDATTSSVKYLH